MLEQEKKIIKKSEIENLSTKNKPVEKNPELIIPNIAIKDVKEKENENKNCFSSSWWEKVRIGLKKAFPEESFQDNTGRTGRPEAGIKPQYVIERLNEIFGPQRWMAREVNKSISTSKQPNNSKAPAEFVNMKIELLIGYFKEWINKETGEPNSNFIVMAKREGYGGCRIINENLADATKGAETDAIKKAASKFDIAEEAYKGNISMDQARRGEAKYQAKALGVNVKKSLAPLGQKAPLCPLCGEIMSWRISVRGPFWGCSTYPACKGVLGSTDVDINGNITRGTESSQQIDY